MIYALYTALLEHFYGRLSYIYRHTGTIPDNNILQIIK